MELRTVRILRGPNVWANFPVIEALVDLQELDEVYSHQIPGFNDRLMAWLPGMIEHRCGLGYRGGFFERLRTGTLQGHILEHVTLELQDLCGLSVGFGKARDAGEPGVYKVVIQYEEEDLGRACLETAWRMLEAAREGTPFDVAAEIQALRSLADAVCQGPSTRAIVKAAWARRIPRRRISNDSSLVVLGQGVKQRRILTAETDRTGAIASSIAKDKELTRSLLRGVGVPVPSGRPVESAEDAWEAAQELGLPVVVKPREGNHGRGVAAGLTTREQVIAGFETARKVRGGVLVERYVSGAEHRLLVVGGRMVAAYRGEPARVVGDGRSTVAQLVEELNRDPRRGDEMFYPLDRIELNEVARLTLAGEGHTPESVPGAGETVIVDHRADLCADVTERVHPEVAARAVEAARVVGLDIAGLDVMAEDIGRPLEDQGGAIVEVNAGPGLGTHLRPAEGVARPVGEAIVEMLFPDGQDGRIPTVGVTGTNGKTTVTRLIAHIAADRGRVAVGMTCTDGIYLNGRRLEAGDCSGPKSAKAVLLNPTTEVAVLEAARGGIIREGLGFDRCHVGVVTNIGEGDHLGLGGISTVEQMALVKRTVVDIVLPTGYAVLKADDRLTAEMADHCRGGVIFFAQDGRDPVLARHLAEGKRGVYAEGGMIVLAEGSNQRRLVSLDQVPLTHLEPIRLKVGQADPSRRANEQQTMDNLELVAQFESAVGQCFEALGRDPKALEAYDKAAEAVRASRRLKWVEPWLSAAGILLRQGRFDGAAAKLEDGLDSLRDEPTLLTALARVRLAEQASLPREKQSYKELERVLERGLKAAPADSGLIKLQANYLTATGQAEEAAALLQAATDPRHRPRDPELFINLAEILRREGRLDEAAGVLDRGLETIGDRSALQLARAQVLLLQGHEKAAVDTLIEGTVRVPDDQKTSLWRALGDLHRRRGDSAAARQAYARWAELAPADPQPRLQILDLALNSGDDRAIAGAIASLEKIGGLAAQLARAAMLLNGQAGADQLDEATRSVDRIVAENPSKSVGYLLRGQILERKGDADGAAQAYREARTRDGGPEALRALMLVLARGRKFDEMQRLRAELAPGELTPELEQMVAGVALTMGETDEAERIAREIVQGDPQGLNTRVWEAGILNALGKPEEAEKSLLALIDRRPTELAPRVALMMFFHNRNREAEAAEVVKQIRERVKADQLNLVLAGCFQVIGDQERAAEAYREALRERPDDPETNRRAIAFFKASGQADEAIAALRALIGRDPDQDWAGRELALLLSGRAGDQAAWAEALELTGVSAQADDTPEDRLIRATVLARSPDPDRRREAIDILEALISEGAGTVAAGSHDLLARILGDAGELPEALEHAKGAAARGTDAGPIAYYIELLLRDQKPGVAEPEVERLARLEGESLRVAGYRALILRSKDRGSEGAELLERAVANLPDAPGSEASARGVLDLLVRLDQPDAATRVGRELAKRWPSSGWALGLILARAGSRDEALRACQDAAQAGATVEAALAAAQIASEQPEGPGAEDRLARADGLLEAALRAKPDDAALLFSRAVVQRSRGRDDQAATTYRELLTGQPNNIAALNNLAWTLSEDLEKPDEALGPIDRAIGLSDSPSLLDTRGVVLTRLNRLDEAIKDLEAAAKAKPSAMTYYHLARAHHKAGHADAFREARDRAREAGLKPEQLQPGERSEMKQLME